MSKDNENGKPSELVFNIGEVISGFTLVSKIDEGGFGQVFKVSKDKQLFAMKLESSAMDGGSAIKLEISVLKGLPANSVFPAMISGGRRARFHFLVLELLGDNLKTLKAKGPNPDVFSDGTWSRLGIQCLFALKQMHDAGFVHRDVKPTNFAVGLHQNNCRRIMLFDFGLARRFVKEEVQKARRSPANSRGSPAKRTGAKSRMQHNSRPVDMRVPTVFSFRKPRPHTDFRGTELYASPNAHQLKELGRVDDVWSMLYMVAEFFRDLPWVTQDAIPTDDVKNQCTMLRIFFDEKNPRRLTASMEEKLEQIEQMLKEKNYYQCPDYQLVYEFLRAVMLKSKVSWSSAYDWEKTEPEVSKKKDGSNAWEDPKDYFQSDKWRELRVPEMAVTPKSGRQRRADTKAPRKLSKEEDPSANVDDESLDLPTPLKSQKKDWRSVKQDGKQTRKQQEALSVYGFTSTKKE